MSHVEAVFRHGVFEPVEPVVLPENQRVRLSIELTEQESAESWLDDVRRLQAAVVKRQGHLADRAPDIAEDRRR